MLEQVDLTQRIKKKAYKQVMPDLQNRLYSLQKAAWEAGIPVVILFEGWDAAGVGGALRKLTEPLDPRGFKLHSIREAKAYEKKRPWMWRFWLKLPQRGDWSIFDRSWYSRVLSERVEGLSREKHWLRAYRDILNFERTISEDGHLVIKFFLHISQQEQRMRLEKRSGKPSTAWRVTPKDWERHHRYEDWLQVYEDVFVRTDTEWGIWDIIEANDRRIARVKICESVINAVESRLKYIVPAEQLAVQEALPVQNKTRPASDIPVHAPEEIGIVAARV